MIVTDDDGWLFYRGLENSLRVLTELLLTIPEVFCSKCGSMLIYVCKDCYTQLSDDAEKYCVRCLAKHEDRKDKAKKVAAGVGGGALAVGGVILTYGKKALDIARKIKG